MENHRRRAILAALLLLVVPLSIYSCMYFARSTSRTFSNGPGAPWFVVRQYPMLWEAKLFQPAARVEAFVTGNTVSALAAPAFPSR